LIGKWRLELTRSRKSLPGLKCGTYLPDRATASPVLGLRPIRGGRKCNEKLPNPRISMRSPLARASLIKSRRCLTANSTSLAGRCFCLRAITSMSSDLVIFRFACSSVARNPRIFASARQFFLEKLSERRANRGSTSVCLVAAHCFLLVVNFLCLDRQLDRTVLAIDVRELGFNLFANLDHQSRILYATTCHLRSAQRAFDSVAKINHSSTRVDFGDLACDDCVLRMLCEPSRERIFLELLDTQ